MSETKDKRLFYQCPQCMKAAFYLDGAMSDYANGTKLSVYDAKQKNGCSLIVDSTIHCEQCQFPFTTGHLYLMNLKEERLS